MIHKICQITDRHIGQRTDILITDRNGKRTGFQTLSFARSTWNDLHESFIFFFYSIGCCFAITPLDILDHTFKRDIINACTALSGIFNTDGLSFGTMHDQISCFFGKILIWRVDIETIISGDRIKDRASVACLGSCRLPAGYGKCTFGDAQSRIRHDQGF